MNLARFARATRTPLPLLTGAAPSAAEVDAMTQVAGEWSLAESLLVALAERVDMIRYMIQARISKQNAQIDKPLRIPRPGEAPPQDDVIVMRPHEFASRMAGRP